MTKNFKIIYDGSSREDDHSAYSDSDWAGDPREHRSISCYVFKVAGAAVSWSSKKQSTMALSSTEGEYIVLTHVAKEAIWIQEFLGEVFPDFVFPTTILGNNQGTLALAVNPAFHAHTKHIQVCHHFIHDCIKAEDVDLEYMPTGNQVVDIFTKGLPSIKHKKFTSMMGLAEDYAH